MKDRIKDECPNCGGEIWFWPEYGWAGCTECGLEGAVDVYPCPKCERLMITIGRQAFCLGCGYEATAAELQELEVADHEKKKRYYKQLMEQKPKF